MVLPARVTPEGKDYLIKQMDDFIEATGGHNSPRWKRVNNLLKIMNGEIEVQFANGDKPEKLLWQIDGF